MTARPSWYPDWTGDIAAIVAGGPSVTQQAICALRGRCRVIVVNNSYRLAPWAAVLYAADWRWWDYHKGATEFAGMKICPEAGAAKRHGLQRIGLLGEEDCDSDRIEIDPTGLISRGGNSAFQAVNIASQFGARRQIWLGFDFTGDHWHGKHPEPLRNPTPQRLDSWRRRLDAQADHLLARGIEVVNASPISLLTAYPKMEVDDAFARWKKGN